MRKMIFLICICLSVIIMFGACSESSKSNGSLDKKDLKHEPVSLGPRATGIGPHTEKYNNFTEEEKKAQALAGTQLIKDISAAYKEGKSSYTIPSGYYRFNSGINLIKYENFELIGSDDVWLIGAPSVNRVIHLNNCKNVIVKNVNIDHDEITAVQGTIYKYNADTGLLKITIDPGYTEFFEKFMKTYSGAIYRIMYYDKDANEKQIALSAHANGAFAGATESGVTESGEKIYTVKMTSNIHSVYRPELEVGDKVLIPVNSGDAAMSLENCDHCTVDSVNIYSSSSFVISDNFGVGGTTYRNVYIGRLEGTDRLICGCSDGIHTISQKYGPKIENCEISYVCDDSFNCHTFIGMTVSKLSSNEYIVAFPMISFLDNESEVSFFKYVDYTDYGSANVTEAEQIKKGEWIKKISTLRDGFIAATGYDQIRGFDQPVMYRIKLDRDVDLPDYTAISNYGYSNQNAEITDSFFHDVNGNGIVTRSNGIKIEGCTVARVADGVAVSGGGNWTEGPMPRNVQIINNVFEETNQSFEVLMDSSSGAINICPGYYSATVVKNDSVIRNILIENNTFYNCNGETVFACNTDGLTIRNNKIIGQMASVNTSYLTKSKYYLIETRYSKNITVEGNSYSSNGSTISDLSFSE